MKKIFFSLLIAVIFYGCIDREPPEPPRLYILPQDTIVDISVVNPAEFYISGTSDEDLKTFSINTDPFIYMFDTTFGTFVHKFSYTAVIRLPQNIESLGSDSLIQVTFRVSDYVNTTQVVKYLRVRNPYPSLVYDTVTLVFPDGNFLYDVASRRAYDSTAQAGSFDFGFAYNTDQGLTVASPDAFWLSGVCGQNGIAYSTTSQRHTLINYTQINFEEMDDKFMYYLDVNPQYISGNQAYGIGVDGLGAGTVFVFKTAEGRKGAAKVVSTTVNSIKLEIKAQSRVQDDQ